MFKKKQIRFDENDEAEEYYEFKDAHFNSYTFTIMNSNEIIDAFDRASEEIKNKVAVWISERSQWVIEEILGHYINIVKYLPLRGNSYVPLSEELRNSKKRFN